MIVMFTAVASISPWAIWKFDGKQNEVFYVTDPVTPL